MLSTLLVKDMCRDIQNSTDDPRVKLYAVALEIYIINARECNSMCGCGIDIPSDNTIRCCLDALETSSSVLAELRSADLYNGGSLNTVALISALEVEAGLLPK